MSRCPLLGGHPVGGGDRVGDRRVGDADVDLRESGMRSRATSKRRSQPSSRSAVDDVEAVGAQAVGDRGADPARRAGDQRAIAIALFVQDLAHRSPQRRSARITASSPASQTISPPHHSACRQRPRSRGQRSSERPALGDLDDVADHQRAGLLAHAAEQVPLALGVEVVDAEHGDHEIPGAVGQRVLHPSQAHLLPAELARLENHLRARVEAGDPGRRDTAPNPPVVSAVPKPELEHRSSAQTGSRRPRRPGARRSPASRRGSSPGSVSGFEWNCSFIGRR